jgi:outer membrane immunogenic protein
MKRLLLAAFALFSALAMAAPSFAADLPRPGYRPAYKAPMWVAPFSWSGFYGGINAGYGFGTSNWAFAAPPVATGNFDLKGGLVGGTLGYNLQTGVWVWGLETDLDASWIKGTDNGVCIAPGCETRNTWLGTARLRVGYAWDHFLPYVTGGAAYGSIKLTPAGPPTQTNTKFGWTVGGGLEWAFSGPWSAKLEYLYVDLGDTTCDVAICGTPTNVSFKTNVIRLGLNYRFF